MTNIDLKASTEPASLTRRGRGERVRDPVDMDVVFLKSSSTVWAVNIRCHKGGHTEPHSCILISV